MDREVVPVVEGFLAGGHRANEIGLRVVVGQVSLEVLARAELLVTGAVSAFMHTWGFFLDEVRSVLEAESLVRGTLASERDEGGRVAFGDILFSVLQGLPSHIG